jgi:hypothetical protein
MENVASPGSPAGAAPPEAPSREFVTICAECKKVISLPSLPRRSRSDAPGADSLVSHGICEACARRLYGSLFNRGG